MPTPTPDAPIFDEGGFLPPGVGIVRNASGHPEYIVRPERPDDDADA